MKKIVFFFLLPFFVAFLTGCTNETPKKSGLLFCTVEQVLPRKCNRRSGNIIWICWIRLGNRYSVTGRRGRCSGRCHTSCAVVGRLSVFNAGKGAVTTLDGVHELDAAVMDGSNLQAGAVAGLRDIKNPILAARHVMEDSPHVLLIGEGASAFAAQMGLTVVENSYFSTPERLEQLIRIQEKQEEPDPKGTVGCVALDKKGNLAAATSTGGMSGKRWGRVGDVPIIGAGTYANNNTVAISGTGHGELWIRRCVAFDISALMDYKGMSVEEAAREVIFQKIDKMEGSGGGVICVDKNGNIAMEFNTGMMYRAWATAGGQRGTAIE